MKLKLVPFFLFIVSIVTSQQTDYVDFKTAKVDIDFGDLLKKEVIGTVSYKFEILKDIDAIYMDAKAFEGNSLCIGRRAYRQSIQWKTAHRKIPF